ncbi:MAG: hypothetical protein C0501_03310 [Isosphaera sp.]|nr:hypothetical protein [Isosphaera sp.]
MRVDLFGLTMDAPGVTFYLWSPWRCSALEHKLFESLRAIPGASPESAGDELRLHVTDPKGWKAAVQTMSRVLKGWQEEASDGGKEERRTWRWLIESDVDASGYDMQGERASFWAYLRLGLDRGGPGDGEKGEDIDLNGFGVQVWGTRE